MHHLRFDSTESMLLEGSTHPLFEHKLRRLIALLGALLLFLPKCNLFSFANTHAGIRIDDLLLLGLGWVVLTAHFALRSPLSAIERWIGVIIGLQALSVLTAWLSGHLAPLPLDSHPLYAIRLLEYFLFFYVGRALLLESSVAKLLLALLAWQAIWIGAQSCGWIGAFTVSGYVDPAALHHARLPGACAHPSELSLTLVLIYSYFAFGPYKRTIWTFQAGRLQLGVELADLLFFGILWLVGLTGARIAMLSLVILFLGSLGHRHAMRTFPRFVTTCLLIVVLAATSWKVIQRTEINERMERLSRWSNLKVTTQIWHATTLSHPPFKLEASELANHTEGDLSWFLRLHKWMYVGKVYCLRPWNWLFGLGPGSMGVAVDGGWVRLLGELGVVGLCAYLELMRRLARLSPVMAAAVTALAINMLFIDSYLSYKPMSVLFLLAGWAAINQKGKIETSRRQILALR